MGDIYLFKMLILLIKMHIYVLNQKSKGFTVIFWLKQLMKTGTFSTCRAKALRMRIFFQCLHAKKCVTLSGFLMRG